MNGWGRWLAWRIRLLLHRNYRIDYSGGVLIVSPWECKAVNLAVLRLWANAAWKDMSAVWGSSVPRCRTRVVGMRDPGNQGYYSADSGIVFFKCGVEQVIRHELFHRWAHKMGLAHWRTIDHPDGHKIDGSPFGRG